MSDKNNKLKCKNIKKKNMGDTTKTIHPCPKCGEQMETFDAPSSLIYLSECEKCGHKDNREYFATGENEIVLSTKEEPEDLMKKDEGARKFREELEKMFDEGDNL